MRSRILLAIVACWFSIPAIGQEYQIMHVKGHIRIDGELIKPGDKINGDQEIKFETTDAAAAALSPEKGRYIIKVDKSKPINSDLIYILSATVAPVRGGMSTRAGSISNALNLKNYFGSSPYVWIGDKIILEISEDAYVLDDEHFFFLRYNYKDQVVNKRIDHDGNKLKFSKSSIFMVDEQPVDKMAASDFELYYYDQIKEESEIITPAYFVYFPLEEARAMIDQLEGVENPVQEIADILSEFYGVCDPKQLEVNLAE